MNNLIFIPFTCGEHLLDDTHMTYVEHKDYPFSGYQLINFNPVQVLSYRLDDLIMLINNRIYNKKSFGDDSFYDYIPDYIDQILALASYMDNQTFKAAQERIAHATTRYFKAFPHSESDQLEWTHWLTMSQYNIHNEILAYLREVKAID
jgi:hypothetical protein